MFDIVTICTTKKLLRVSKDDKQVYFDTINSHAATHFADTPGLKDLVTDAVGNREIATNLLRFDVNMGRIVGTTDVVEVDKADTIVWAIRTKRFEQGLVPWVKLNQKTLRTCLRCSRIA